ncbi:MAG TPA: glycosyltransferase family 2 protein [bacterium]|nr:glycosyltransferase family 2 protein [bacterium]
MYSQGIAETASSEFSKKGHPLMPGVSVIVSTCGDASRLRETIEALIEQDCEPWQFEIIVLDDLATLTDLSNPNLPVRRIRCLDTSRVGQIALGAGVARFPLIAFLESGQIPRFDWISKTVPFFVDSTVYGVRGRLVTEQTETPARVQQVIYDERCLATAREGVFSRCDSFVGIYRTRTLCASVIQSFSDAFEPDVLISETIKRMGGRIVFADLAVVFIRRASTLGDLWRMNCRPRFWKSLLENDLLDGQEQEVIKEAMYFLTPSVLTLLLMLLGFWSGIFHLLAVLAFLWLFGRIWSKAKFLAERSFLRPHEIAVPLFVGALAEGVGFVFSFLQTCWSGLPKWSARIYGAVAGWLTASDVNGRAK